MFNGRSCLAVSAAAIVGALVAMAWLFARVFSDAEDAFDDTELALW